MSFVLYAAVLVVAAALLYFAHRRGHLLPASLGLLTLAAVAFGLAYAASETRYRDADGWVDCWPGCTAIQEATRWGLFLSPGAAFVVAAALALGALARRRSSGRATAG